MMQFWIKCKNFLSSTSAQPDKPDKPLFFLSKGALLSLLLLGFGLFFFHACITDLGQEQKGPFEN